jgi:iron complex outermembrane receptor protein
MAASVSSAAIAQSTAPQDAPASSRPGGDEPGSSRKNSEFAEDIVVTALRRDQSISTAPIAISVVSGQNLASNGVVSPLNLPQILPNVQNGVAGFAIRGVASGDFSEKGDPSTAFSLDGIYIARPQEQNLSFFDIERVEVLRGPQGTLYGRNATAGAINVISAMPVRDLAARGTAEIGNYKTRRLTGMVNVPIGSDVALRLSGAYNFHAGFTATRDGTDALDDRNDLAGRARLRIGMDDDSSLVITGDIGRIRNVGPGSIPAARASNISSADRRYQNPGRDNRSDLTARGTAVEFNKTFDFAKLTYLFGYRSSTTDFIQSFGDNGPYVDEHNVHSQDSQELRLSSTGDGRVQWIAGVFYFHEVTTTRPIVHIVGGPTLLFDLHARARSIAAFTQATATIVPGFRVTGGIRYTDDDKSRTGPFAILGGPSFNYDAAVHFRKWNWKGGLEVDVAPRVLFFASASTGYKSGGFNDGNPQTQPALYYNPENITSYEAGLKGRFFNNKLSLSTNAFYYNYEDLQLSSIPPSGGIITLNAAKAKIRGLEAEGKLVPVKDGSLDFNVAYLDAKYDKYLPLGAAGPDYAGKRLDRAPPFSFRLGYTQDFLLSRGRISASLSTKYSSSYKVTDFNLPLQFVQKAFWRTDASLGYFAPDERWFVQGFVRNLENKSTLGTISFSSFTLDEPRLYGVRAGFNF